MFHRLSNPLLTNDFFMFGARGTGKTSLLEALFADPETKRDGTRFVWLNLLDDEKAKRFLLNPKLLETETSKELKEKDWIIIDEVQKVPALLDYVHHLIEKRKIRFALTGSSARKLKRAQANLLGGRAFVNYLHPLTSFELKEKFNLLAQLAWGSLPKTVALESDLEKTEFLLAYVNTYLKEEIKQEQIVRKLEPFIRFLEVAAQCNGEIINMAKVARDTGTDAKNVERFYEILTDTLLGFFLEPYHSSVRKRQSQKSKFYYFDTGVKRALENTLTVNLLPKTQEFGKTFEHFFILECIRLNDYLRKRYKFFYLHTKDDLEIDLIVERPGLKKVLIEIKSGTDVDETEITKLQKIKKDLGSCELWVASRVENARNGPFYEVLPWQTVLERLFGVLES